MRVGVHVFTMPCEWGMVMVKNIKKINLDIYDVKRLLVFKVYVNNIVDYFNQI